MVLCLSVSPSVFLSVCIYGAFLVLFLSVSLSFCLSPLIQLKLNEIFFKASLNGMTCQRLACFYYTKINFKRPKLYWWQLLKDKFKGLLLLLKDTKSKDLDSEKCVFSYFNDNWRYHQFVSEIRKKCIFTVIWLKLHFSFWDLG